MSASPTRHDHLFLSALAALSLAIAGCGGGDEASPGTDAGGQTPDASAGEDAGTAGEDAGTAGEDAGAGAGDAGAGDAGTAGEDAGATPDAGPSASVSWITEVEPRELDGDIALDFFYQYELVVPDGDLSYSLSLEQCWQMAGEAEDCFTDSRSNLPGTSGIRWGIDPSQYAVGVNRYRFHLELTQGGTLVDEDTVELVVTVTSCGECGPGTE